MSAERQVKLSATDPRIAVAYDILKSRGFLVPKSDLADALSTAMQAELRVVDVEHKGTVA